MSRATIRTLRFASETLSSHHPSKVLKKGDDVEAAVLEIDKTNQRISLGLKQLAEDP